MTPTESNLKELAKLYQNFKLNKSGLSGEFKASEQFVLHVESETDPETWKAFNSPEGTFIKWTEIKGSSKVTIEEFISSYKQVMGNKEPLSNLANTVSEGLPESEEEKQRKLEELDRIMDEGNTTKKQNNAYEEVQAEIITLPAPVGISGIVRPAVSAVEALAAWKEFQALKKAILEPSDLQRIQNKDFIKKSGWRKFATFYNLTDRIVEETKIQVDDKEYIWKIKVICTASNGRQTEGVAMCSSKEKSGPRQMHDTYSTCHTRAKNRAISDMIAAGEVSAEEMM